MIKILIFSETMSVNTSIFDIPNLEKKPVTLKFGIDRLLSTSESKTHQIHGSSYVNIVSSTSNLGHITKPTPTVAVPCSSCVTSLYRCCKASPTGSTNSDVSGYLGRHIYDHSSNAYTVQPIRPFATRPSMYYISTTS